MPQPGSTVLDWIPAGECGFVQLGYSLEGEQHLAQFGIDPLAPISTDQRGVSRPQGSGCDAGAVGAQRRPRRVAWRPSSRRRSPANARPVERMIERMERTARPLGSLDELRQELPVSEYGDPDHRFGFNYDERDGPDWTQAGARHRQRTARPPSQHGPVRVLAPQGLPLARNGTDPAGYAGGRAPPTPPSCRDRVRRARTSLGALEGRLEAPRAERGAPGEDVGAVRRVGVVPVLDPGDRVRGPGGALRLPLSGQGRRARLSAGACDRPQRVGRPRLLLLGRRAVASAASSSGGDETDAPPPPTPGTALQYCNDEPGEAGGSTRCIWSGRSPRTRYGGGATGSTTSTRTSTLFSRT